MNFESEEFRGRLTVFGLGSRSEVELDCEDLMVEEVRQGATVIPFHFDRSRRKLVIPKSPTGSGPIQISYSGRASRDLQTGFFVSRLGEGKALTTMMEPEGCRRFLPCFDRPSEKAVFRLRVVTDPSLVAISNSESESRLLPDWRREWTFAQTPPMSTISPLPRDRCVHRDRVQRERNPDRGRVHSRGRPQHRESPPTCRSGRTVVRGVLRGPLPVAQIALRRPDRLLGGDGELGSDRRR